MLRITFTIDLQGGVTNDVDGGDGINCLEATKPYEAALGDPDPDRDLKPEASTLNATSVEQSRIYQ